MKYTIYILLVGLFIFNCSSTRTSNPKSNEITSAQVKNDTLKIVNEELEYEIIIIDPLFNSWLVSNARQRGFYNQNFLETRNQLFVMEWNQRVLQPQRYNPRLYELQIDYDPNIDYGYEVNYLLYNYFLFFQINYKQRLGPFVPRI